MSKNAYIEVFPVKLAASMNKKVATKNYSIVSKLKCLHPPWNKYCYENVLCY